ncbi:hypothetical protein ACE7GA_00370 [Roseomonas sp. CCTCC AB2023176]|uniref:hypothetical protein n=1 Tax=Roseomonas sp. CCTCC AB2023176 TaxID=3342640 RepID=UPI0035DF3DB9
MARKKPDSREGTWAEAIAAHAGRPVEAVIGFLQRHDIREQALIPRPVDLTVGLLSFAEN